MKLEYALQKNDIKATFLKEQLFAFGPIKQHWGELSIWYCVLWQSKSPTDEFVYNVPLFTLPSKSTLKEYIGTCAKEHIGGTYLEIHLVGGEETFGSLIIDMR